MAHRFQTPQFGARAARQAPVHSQPQGKPEWHDIAANAHGDEAQALRVNTRTVKMNIALLQATLYGPLSRTLSRDERIETRIRLEAYTNELHRRGDLAKAKHAQGGTFATRSNSKSPSAKAHRSVDLH